MLTPQDTCFPSSRKSRKRASLDALIHEAMYIEAESAREAGALGYMCRALTLATMPHSKIDENAFERTNGAFSMAMVAHPKIGLPYGSVPRLLMSWLTTEALRTKCPELEMGHTLTEFMKKLDLVPTGGRWGSITRLKKQTKRLFACAILSTYDGKSTSGQRFDAGVNFAIVEAYELWWQSRNPDQDSLWQSRVKLGPKFYQEIVNHPVPIDLRAIKALKGSPMALDVYCWLTHRYSYLRKQTEIPWAALQMQFGAGYPIAHQGTRDFKKKLRKQLGKVLLVYSRARVDEGKFGLVLKPSPTHVPARKR